MSVTIYQPRTRINTIVTEESEVKCLDCGKNMVKDNICTSFFNFIQHRCINPDCIKNKKQATPPEKG